MLTLTAIACAMWVGLLALPFRPWSTRERIEAADESGPANFQDVTVLIPARDEAQSIVRTLRGVAAQGKLARIILVDDQSSDGTGELAASLAIEDLEIVRGRAPDEGWSGKLWALHQGLDEVRTPYLLLLDADIELVPGMLEALRRKLLGEQRALVSVMAALSMRSAWEKLLIPPFIYFFKLIYPFALGNSSCKWVAAAAGGCILVRTDALRDIGGFGSLRGALIDDCTLARKIKDAGGRIWLGLSHGVRAVRPYDGLAEIWNMVARTAFTQLRYSVALLLICTALMGISFVIPVIGLVSGSGPVKALALGGLLAMTASYAPVLRFYRQGWGWLITLPLAASLYLAMTWTSALRYWRGERSRWKNRVYERGV
jgi:hopene-associated glycosyltransferase HpnB